LIAIGFGLVGLVGLRARQSLQTAIDRLFFREQYDANQVLLALADRLRDVRSIDALVKLLTSEVDRALHLEAVDVLLRDHSSQEFRSPLGRSRSLPLSGYLVRLLEDTGVDVNVDLERPGAPARYAPAPEREWLADSGFRRLLPIIASEGELIGLVALGAKRSEIDFTDEDRALLSGVARAGALALDSRLMRGAAVAAVTEGEQIARECPACGLVASAKQESCVGCSSTLVDAALPIALFGKYRLEERIGAGGMGVVYRAIDVELNRAVAVKSLPRVSPEDALSLRREARAMASVSHPNLATIYAAEAWHGMPILVIELLSGGTLEDRLRGGPLSVAEGLDLGLRLSSALERVHSSGVLHRDVKPSNVGYTDAGVPKLLDFGLARVAATSVPAGTQVSLNRAGTDTPSASTEFVGTPLYLSPEALWGEAADASLDLWATAVVLFEAMAQAHPFERPTWQDTLHRITSGRVPDIRKSVPGASDVLAEFFRNALHRDRSRRPGSAAELHARLRLLR
jgi:hypothetical protein